MLMANVWYPAAAPRPRLRRERRIDRKKDKNNDNASGSNLGREDDDGYVSGSDGGCDSGDDLGKHWPDDEAAKVHYEAMAQEKLIQAQVLVHPMERGAGLGRCRRRRHSRSHHHRQRRKAEARRRRRRSASGLMARAHAGDDDGGVFRAPGVDRGLLQVGPDGGAGGRPGGGPPAASSPLDGAPRASVLFSHSFTGMKEQTPVCSGAASGHIVVAVDHPHDAALVLYPDGSTADFRGYDSRWIEPRNWWRFRHEHARCCCRPGARSRGSTPTGTPTARCTEGGPDARRRGGALVRGRRVSDAAQMDRGSRASC